MKKGRTQRARPFFESSPCLPPPRGGRGGNHRGFAASLACAARISSLASFSQPLALISVRSLARLSWHLSSGRAEDRISEDLTGQLSERICAAMRTAFSALRATALPFSQLFSSQVPYCFTAARMRFAASFEHSFDLTSAVSFASVSLHLRPGSTEARISPDFSQQLSDLIFAASASAFSAVRIAFFSVFSV